MAAGNSGPDTPTNIRRSSRSPAEAAAASSESPEVKDELEVTVGNALKLTTWDRISQFPRKPCVVTSLSTGLLTASAVGGVMLIRRRSFSSSANAFAATSILLSGATFGFCQFRLREQKLKVIELQREIRRKQEDEVLKQRLEARLQLREEERKQKRESWLSSLGPDIAPDSSSRNK